MNARNREFSLVGIIISLVFLILSSSLLQNMQLGSLIVIIFGLILNIALPGLIIDFLSDRLDVAKCGGLPNGGFLIGCTERTMIFLAFLISYYDGNFSYASILSFLSIIIAGKAIFRYSGHETNSRNCADWHILGTFLSITMALALTWLIFKFLLVGWTPP